ncbi:MAG: hypothetical protein WA736_08290 [Candidatus Acidiferrum sp.]
MRHQKRSEFEKTKSSKTPNEVSSGKTTLYTDPKSAQTLREVLTRNNMTLSQVSKESRKLFPGQSLYHIPHNLYFDLRDGQFTPNIYQLIALSCVSGYSLIHWLSVFGFHLDDIPRLQLRLSFPRTMLLDSALYDGHALIEWFEGKGEPLLGITPLIQILTENVTERVAALQRINRVPFIYAKVGTEDDFSFPELLPGSIVRADPRAPEVSLAATGGKVSRDLFLVEHAQGLNCCRLQKVTPRRVALVSTKLTAPRMELQLGTELTILGTIDMEIRSLKSKSVASGFRTLPTPKSRELLRPDTPGTDLRHLLRKSRQRAGLSFRQASAMSAKLAQELGDQRYFTAIGSLSDYESAEALPRHIHKVVSLCTLYSIGFWHLLKASGLAIGKLGQRPISEDLTEGTHWAASSRHKDRDQQGPKGGSFLSILMDRFEEIPLFLRNALPELCGMPRLAPRDVFWVGEIGQEFHAPLRGAAFLVVNQRIRTPFLSESEPEWKQPVYLLARRDGSYFCGRFALAGNTTVLHSLSSRPPSPKPHESGGDAEIVGRVVTVLRRIAARR